MAAMILPDTDVLVDYFKGHAKAVALLRKHGDNLVLSAIVVAELYAGVRDGQERDTLDDFVSLFPILPVTAAVAKAGGTLRNTYLKPHGVGLADALIAATAAECGAQLKTLNTKHYPMFKGLRPAYSKMR